MRPEASELQMRKRNKTMPHVLLDSGFWYALCDQKDNVASREKIDSIYQRLQFHNIILPWPVAYETLRTSLCRKPVALKRFQQEAKQLKVDLLDDTAYRDDAYDLVFSSSLIGERPLSMVDCLIRLIIEDENVKVDYLVTFNVRDFHDVCMKRGIELCSS